MLKTDTTSSGSAKVGLGSLMAGACLLAGLVLTGPMAAPAAGASACVDDLEIEYMNDP